MLDPPSMQYFYFDRSSIRLLDLLQLIMWYLGTTSDVFVENIL